MKQIGELFILRININLVGSVLDSPVRAFTSESVVAIAHQTLGSVLGMSGLSTKPSAPKYLTHVQSYPDLQPLYEAARSYLEIPQRVHLLNTRVEVCLLISILLFYLMQVIGSTRHVATPKRVRF